MHIQVLCLLSLTFLNFKIILSFKLSFMHQFNTGKLPKIFDSLFVKWISCKHNVNTRFAFRSTFYLPKIRTNYGKFNIRFNGPKLWNELDERFKCRTSNQFKTELTSHFVSLYYNLYWYFDGLYLFIFCFVLYSYFCAKLWYLCVTVQCICCASFLSFTLLIINNYGHPTSLAL